MDGETISFDQINLGAAHAAHRIRVAVPISAAVARTAILPKADQVDSGVASAASRR